MPLEGRVAIITGAGGGLGRQHALFLAGRGARVVVNDVAQDAADATAREIEAHGGHAMSIGASVTDEAAIAELARRVNERWGRIDILVNNAGILRDKSFGKMTLDAFRLVVEVHLMGAVICTKAVWDIMRSQNHGRIVLTTSSSGLFGNFGQANYGAAKMALVGLMQTLAIEGERHGIRVNCLAPSAATGMTEGVLPPESLALLDPALVSPGLLALVGDAAPTRMILCAGAGHFAAVSIDLSPGQYIGGGADAAERVVAGLDAIADRNDAIVPARGFVQAEREVESAQRARGPAAALNREE